MSAVEPVAPRRPLRKRPLFWVLVSLVGLLVVLAVGFVSAVPLSADILRRRIITSLSEKLDSDVELDTLSLQVFPGLRAEGGDLRIRRRGTPAGRPPLIAVKKFHVDASVMGVWRKHVQHVQVEGLDINILPAEERPDSTAEDRQPTGQTRGASSQAEAAPREARTDPLKSGVVIDRLDTDDARLIIIPGRDDRAPKIWAVHHLTMHNLGALHSWPFHATLTNGVPPGEIDVNGGFGPWDRDEPGDTPLDGDFVFAKADLGVFKGISGTLASHGSFAGTLSKVTANGETYTPDFMVTVGGHPFPLYAKYQALIDGTNGDTRLENVDAWFLSSYVNAKGAVLGGPKGQKGRTVSLDVRMDKSRIEDVMKMAVKTASPPMVGALKLNTKFVLPPGETDVSDRLRLDGQFWITKARFTNYDVQGKIEELSKRGSAKTAEPVRERVASDFRSTFKLADGRLTLPDLRFAVPGAAVQLAGAYALKAETLDFKGELLLDAKLSQTVTGFKSILLKVVDPLFKQKDGTGSAVPIKIGGSRNAPQFGLDSSRVFKKGD